jgi:predicted enzyme related to lactoylglutathione lyase
MAVDSLVGRLSGVSYLHIPARHPAASAAFYRDVFGWEVRGSPDAPSFSDGTGHVIGRWVTDQAVTGSDGLRAYIYVADVEQTLTAVLASGGQMASAPYPEAPFGWRCSPTPRAMCSESGRRPSPRRTRRERRLRSKPTG